MASEGERRRYDELLGQHHYLQNTHAVGQVLRYVAGYCGQWVAVLTLCSSAWHLKPRDWFLTWSARQVRERRHLIAQNSRFSGLPATGCWPNLASRTLKLVCQRLPADWQAQFGQPVLLVETFVDPNRFRGACYQAAGWAALGRTQGVARCGQDYYLDSQHPKEKSLHHGQRPQLRCHPRRGHPRPCDAPCEQTVERMLKVIKADQLREVYSHWMAGLDPRPLTVWHLDGKDLRNADPAPPRLTEDAALTQAGPDGGHSVRTAKTQSRKGLDPGELSDPAAALD